MAGIERRVAANLCQHKAAMAAKLVRSLAPAIKAGSAHSPRKEHLARVRSHSGEQGVMPQPKRALA